MTVYIEDKEVSRATLTLKPARRPCAASPTRRARPAPCAAFRGGRRHGDRFPDDDRYLFTLNVSPRIKAVIVTARCPASRSRTPTRRISWIPR